MTIRFRLTPSDFTPGAYWVEFQGEIIRDRNAIKMSKSSPSEMTSRWTPISSWPSYDQAKLALEAFESLTR